LKPDKETSVKAAILAILWTALALAQPAPPPGGSPGTSAPSTYNAAYTLNGGTATLLNPAYSASAADTSAVWVTNSGVLILTNPTLVTSGNTSSQDSSSFYGLNAGLLVTAAGIATVSGGTITTTGTGANGGFATGASSRLVLSNLAIKASADGGHGVMATLGGSITLTDVDMTTAGKNSAAIATDRGGGTITAIGGIILTTGQDSPGLYSTGTVSVSGAFIKSTGAEAAVIEGANSITLTNTRLSTTKDKWGVMIYQSMSGDASGTQGTFTMTGGSLGYSAAAGPLFYVTNSTGIINLAGVDISTSSPTLLQAAAGNWGKAGSNGGTAILTASAQDLVGDMIADDSSSIAATLKNNSTLTGKLTRTALSLDAASLWNVTGYSTLTGLTDPEGISGESISNIRGNGFTVTYDPSLSTNSYLGGRTYALRNGGSLVPSSGTLPTAPTITSGGIVNAASGVPGIAPAAWITIYGTRLATAAVAAGSADFVNGSLPTKLGGVTVTIDGQPAYLNYVSPTQINLQAPALTSTGTATVTVTNSAGSASAGAPLYAVMPGLFTSSNYVLAVRAADGATLGPVLPAKPGDILSLFATGLGATTIPVAPGLVFSDSYSTAATPTVTIGEALAHVSYSGLVGAGLYQINLAVPSGLPDGAQSVVVSLNGVASPDGALLKIAAN
jgi:uncharacterized protein (TIGR03437 family)